MERERVVTVLQGEHLRLWRELLASLATAAGPPPVAQVARVALVAGAQIMLHDPERAAELVQEVSR